jgi:demethylmacrocin O-methyltransferase
VSRLARRVFEARLAQRAIPDAFPDYARDPAALELDRRLKRCAPLAGFFGVRLDLLAALCGTDKYGLHDYTPVYEALARPLRRKPVALLELGVGGYADGLGGESLLMWAAYFRKGRIYGIDIEDKTALTRGRIRVYQCSQTDRPRLEALAREIGPFDFVIDDGSHVNADQIESFRILWPFVTNGGWYVVEDVQTSYWPYYGGGTPGTPRHGTSCIGFFKALADSVNETEFLERRGVETVPAIGHIAFHHNLIVLRKDEAPRRSNVPLGNEAVRARLLKPRSSK